MTDTELRTTIAQRLGWTNLMEGLNVLGGTNPQGKETRLPDWTTDLNEAWQLLEKMTHAEEGVDFTLNQYQDGCLAGPMKCGMYVHRGEGDTPARAIYDAFLKSTAIP